MEKEERTGNGTTLRQKRNHTRERKGKIIGVGEGKNKSRTHSWERK
jgi:co-chaperonin GroES (HSP10)